MSIEYTQAPISKHGVRYFNAPGPPQQLADMGHLSNAAVVPASAKIVHIVGQLPWDENGEVPTDMREQIRQCFRNTEIALKAAGVQEGWDAVFSATAYLATLEGDSEEELSKVMGETMKEFFGDNRPLLTGIMVKKIFWPGVRIEMQSQAILT
ncbi:Endoribonuclease L-PSP/chorismate mutase-like protein [Coniochaeta sp. 2T2.1]|nr:Endoribonuclease L-PSP/chorismate mutase-like protein [Coniochaeta sp. 2T2.1]